MRLLEVYGTKTAAAARIIPLSSRALEALDDLPRQISSTEPVWRNRHGRPLSYINWRDTDWREGLQELELQHRSPYQMRHTFATLALSHGAAIDDVASMMGHTDIDEVFRFYRKWIPKMSDRLRGVLDTIGKETDVQADSERR
jgi:integrase